jgi:hypothetical protein
LTVSSHRFRREKLVEASSEPQLNESIYEYNPNNLPPVSYDSLDWEAPPAFRPVFIEIDGKNYAVDVSLFPDNYFEG